MKITYQQIIDTFLLLGNTPAGGKHYFSEELDVCANVYTKYARVYSKRILNGYNAHCFEECVYVYKER